MSRSDRVTMANHCSYCYVERGETHDENCPMFEIQTNKIDMVNHPPHYQTKDGIECIDAIRAALGSEGFKAYCRGQVIKYSWRAGKKGCAAEDMAKAAWYAERA